MSFGGVDKAPEDRAAELVEELFSSHDVAEAELAFGEFADGGEALFLLTRVALEALAPNMALVGALLERLVASKRTTAADVDTLVVDLCNDVADLAVDFPKAPEHVGALLAACKLLDADALLAKADECDDKTTGAIKAAAKKAAAAAAAKK